MAELQGGLIGDWITNFVKNMIANAKFDWTKVDIAKNEQAFSLLVDSIAPALPSGSIVSAALDGVKLGYNSLIESLVKHPPIPNPNPGPIVLGQHGLAQDVIYTKQDAIDYLATLPGAVDPEAREKILQYPQIIAALKKLPPDKALRLANNPAWLDKLISILIEWGPLFLKIVMMILPFFI